MTMTIDSTHQHRLGSLSSPLDHMPSYASSQPQFTNPWVSSAPAAPSAAATHLYPSSVHHQPHAAHQPPRPSAAAASASMSYGGSVPVTSASADFLSINRMTHGSTTSAPYGDPAYTTTASPVHSSSYSASPASYDGMSGYAAAPMRQGFPMPPDVADRRYQQPPVHSDDRRGFADALEASHGMLSMSQETPRNIYGPNAAGRSRGSTTDSYGFPSAHSTSSSVSSTGFSGYYGGSVDSSVSDYSTAGSDIESISSRTLPRPQGLMGTAQVPPAPQSMMGQFSSKVSSSTQKKHKCKVCDKRFTRPSSLQTHMYSHTGEKPFFCEVEGCGRHFSVVSNLRRHKKVHKNDTRSDAGSEDHHSD